MPNCLVLLECLEAASGFEPENNGFAGVPINSDFNDLRHLASPFLPIYVPLEIPLAPYTHPAFWP